MSLPMFLAQMWSRAVFELAEEVAAAAFVLEGVLRTTTLMVEAEIGRRIESDLMLLFDWIYRELVKSCL